MIQSQYKKIRWRSVWPKVLLSHQQLDNREVPLYQLRMYQKVRKWCNNNFSMDNREVQLYQLRMYQKVRKWCNNHFSSLQKLWKSRLLLQRYGLHLRSITYWRSKFQENHQGQVHETDKDARRISQRTLRNGLKKVSHDLIRFQRLKCYRKSFHFTQMKTLTVFSTILLCR